MESFITYLKVWIPITYVNGHIFETGLVSSDFLRLILYVPTFCLLTSDNEVSFF